MKHPICREVLDCASPLALCRNASLVEKRQRTAALQDAGAHGQSFACFNGWWRGILPGVLSVILLAATQRPATAQELVVVVESPAFALDTRLSTGSDTPVLVVTATSDAFTLDTRLSTGSTSSSLVVTAESPAFTLDTRLTGGNPILAALVVTAESGAFTLDTRLPGRREDLIVQAVSPAFDLNTMWVRLRKLTRAPLGPLELYWTTNAAEFPFRPQVTDPPLGPASIWQDVTDPVTESGGLYRVPVTPSGTNRYFRLKL